jgi:hypothetical protein
LEAAVNDWRPSGVNTDQPSAARIYDYSLGGAHNFAIDRAVAEGLYQVYPDARLVGRTNRAFLQRAVRLCCAQGLTQFLDLGSGIPTVGNVHEIAHQIDPECRVVYVDNDPVAVAHTREMLAGVANATIVDADLLQPETVVDAPNAQRLLDFTRPVALMMVAVLHYVSIDRDAPAIVAGYLSRLAPGSCLVVSHTTTDEQSAESLAAVKKAFDETTTPVTHRNRAEVAELFDGLELVEPGVVWTPQWHPDENELLHANPERSATYAGMGYLRG